MSETQRFSSGGPYEDLVGYSRAVRNGPFVWVSGCTSVREGAVIGETPAEQMRVAIGNALAGLELAGASAADVVRTRMYVVDASRHAEIGAVHAEFFGDVRPATAMIEVKGFIDPRMLVEIEVDAFVSDAT